MTLIDFGRFLMLMLISIGIRIWNWTEVTAMSKGGGVPGDPARGVLGVSYDPGTRPECERARRNAIGVGGIGRQALAINLL